MTDTDIKYEMKAVTTVRGMEARSRAKWEQQGWEFVSQEEQPMRRSKLTFRRPKPKTPWIAFAALGGILVVVFVIVMVMSLVTAGKDAEPVAAAPSNPAAEPTVEATEEPLAPQYEYSGPDYKVVSVDEELTAARLSQYWIFSSELDVSSPAYRDKVKAILADIAHNEGTNLFLAEVVQNREIALAESSSTYEAFAEEHGDEYAINTIPQLEAEGWVASYTGGYDYDSGEPNDAAFEIVWWPAGDSEPEAWAPGLKD